MSNIYTLTLRKAAERACADNHTQDEWFHYLRCSTPETVLALLDELEAAEKRIAELEAREVELPPLVDCSNVPFAAHSWNAYRAEAVKALRAAGITVKGE